MTVQRRAHCPEALAILLTLTVTGCGSGTRVVLGSNDNPLAEVPETAAAASADEAAAEQADEAVEPVEEAEGGQAAGANMVPEAQPEAGSGASEPVPLAGSAAAEAQQPPSAPQIPQIAGECPPFVSGSVTLANGIDVEIAAGTKAPSGGSLLFYWHGTGSSAGEYSSLLGDAVNEILTAGGIVVSPQGSLGTGGDCSGTATWSKDDLDWADQIAACAVRDHNIDPRRIYTTGCSSGGLQAGCMGALRSSYVAAVVSNSGGIITPEPIQDSAHIPALMTMHGGPNDVVIVDFTETSHTLGDQFEASGGVWVDCNHMGGHCGSPIELDVAAWDFMKAHPFGVGNAPYASGLPESYPSYCELH